MVIGITEQWHDYQPQLYFVETQFLDKSNPIESAVLNALQTKQVVEKVYVDASDWGNPNSVFRGAEPRPISEEARVEYGPGNVLHIFIIATVFHV